MVQLRNFSALWDKKFSTENLDTPPSPLLSIHIFRQPPRVPLRNVSVRKKFSTENLDTPPPLLSTLSETQHRRVPRQNFFGTVRQKIFSTTENLDTPPSPFLSIHFFAAGNFLKHSTEGFTYEIFRHCETKNFRRKILILPPPLLSINFFAAGNFLKHSTEGFTTKFFGNVRQKFFDGKSWYSTLPPLIHTLFRYRKFSETHRRRVPLRNVSVL